MPTSWTVGAVLPIGLRADRSMPVRRARREQRTLRRRALAEIVAARDDSAR